MSEPLPSTFPVESFWMKVDKSPGCWVWTGRLQDGYGVINHRRKNYRLHRASWFLAGRSIPDDLVLDHLCRNRACVNPDHLELVTNRQNVLRGIGRTAENAQKTHCPSGHPYSGENLRINRAPDGPSRACRTCTREHSRAFASKRVQCDDCGRTVRQGNIHRHRAACDRIRAALNGGDR